MTAFVYDFEKFSCNGVQIIGISAQPAEEGIKLRQRVIEDSSEDRPGMPLSPFPVRLVCDPERDLIQKAGAGRDGKRGFIARPMSSVVDRSGIVRWLYLGDGSPSDRLGPAKHAAVAEAVSQGKAVPSEIQGQR